MDSTKTHAKCETSDIILQNKIDYIGLYPLQSRDQKDWEAWEQGYCDKTVQERMSYRKWQRSIQLHKHLYSQFFISQVKWFDHIWSIAVSTYFQILWSNNLTRSKKNWTTDVSRTVLKLETPSPLSAWLMHSWLVEHIQVYVIKFTTALNPLPTNDAYMCHELPQANKNLYWGLY